MELNTNDCHLCGNDTGAGMCGFDTLVRASGERVTLLLCMECKAERDGEPDFNHPNLMVL